MCSLHFAYKRSDIFSPAFVLVFYSEGQLFKWQNPSEAFLVTRLWRACTISISETTSESHYSSVQLNSFTWNVNSKEIRFFAASHLLRGNAHQTSFSGRLNATHFLMSLLVARLQTIGSKVQCDRLVSVVWDNPNRQLTGPDWVLLTLSPSTCRAYFF